MKLENCEIKRYGGAFLTAPEAARLLYISTSHAYKIIHKLNEELEKILTNLSDAGCGNEELKTAAQFYKAGDRAALVRYFRKCRCSRMEELHESQRRVDCLDYLIRQASKTFS